MPITEISSGHTSLLLQLVMQNGTNRRMSQGRHSRLADYLERYKCTGEAVGASLKKYAGSGEHCLRCTKLQSIRDSNAFWCQTEVLFVHYAVDDTMATSLFRGQEGLMPTQISASSSYSTNNPGPDPTSSLGRSTSILDFMQGRTFDVWSI